ncbi:hypothetical protein L6452_18637 [Arctium lappa]|uniref:Uncharacterized protein n=1 Tax=Arctium lappa TaxID=4217 RepID=A0ACB9C6R2_ARCLA|nr:hypothetical protein L6452_18637 [Arctium lappa]
MSWQFATEDWFEVEVMLFLLWIEAEAEAIREIDAETVAVSCYRDIIAAYQLLEVLLKLRSMSFKNIRCLISYPFEVEIENDVKGDCEAICSWRRSWLLVHYDIWAVFLAPDKSDPICFFSY